MRRQLSGLFALAAILTGAGPVAAQAPPPKAGAVPFTPWANKFFVADNAPAVIVHDFGTVPHGTILVHKMTITNIYDTPMQVIDVRKSCTCLDATPPPQVLQPHDTAELVLSMNAGKFTGANAQSFFVTFGPEFISTAVIRVQATSRADVSMTPGQVNFGVVAPGAKPSQAIAVKYTGRQRDWKITGVVAPTGPLDVQVKESRVGLLGGGPEFTVTVAVKDGATGNLAEPITLKTNDPTAPLVQLSVAGVVQAPVSVSPNKVRFEGGKIGETMEQKVMVRATKAFRVTPVADSGDGLTVETFPASVPVQIVTVKFKQTVAGGFKKEVILPTDLGPAVLQVEVAP